MSCATPLSTASFFGAVLGFLRNYAADHFPRHRTVRRIEVDGDRPHFEADAHLA